jgi:cell surface protein SprA
LGYIRSTTDNQMMFSSPYNVMGVSIVEAFEPLIRVNSTFLNNMSLKLDYTTRRTVNLNISSYQIVEMASKDFTAGVGYRISDFDKIIKFPKNQKTTFNNELRLSADVTYRMQQSINRKIQEAPQATSGDSQFIIKLTADYAMSKMITLQGFFDHQVSKPLVSATAFPQTKSAFGLSLKVSLQN